MELSRISNRVGQLIRNGDNKLTMKQIKDILRREGYSEDMIRAYFFML